MGGKNSVFRKPLGTGKNSVAKAVEKTPILKDVKKGVDVINDNLGPRKVASVYEANKSGLNAVAGVAARGAASYFTLGATEALGVGHHITNQFGGDKEISKYGGTIGTVSGLGGIATTGYGQSLVMNGIAKGKAAGAAVGSSLGNIGTNVAGAAIVSTALNGKPSIPVGALAGGNGENMDFLGQLGKTIGSEAEKWAGGQIANLFNPQGSSAKKNTKSLTSQTVTQPNPVVVKQDNTKMYMMIGGGIAGILILVLAMRK